MNRFIPLTVLTAVLFALWAVALTGSPTATAQVPSTATPAATSTAVPATATPAPAQTPFVITVERTRFCEGPLPAGLFVAVNPYTQFNIAGLSYPYNGAFNWPVPTLVERVNGIPVAAWPNHPACTPAATPVPPRAPDIATPIVIRVVERVPAAPVVAPMVVSQPARASIISPPRTGDAGIGE